MSQITAGQPVFICGYPKSGTTLLASLLDSHPQMLVLPEESKFFQLIVGHPDRYNPDAILKYSNVRAFALREVDAPSGYRDYRLFQPGQFESMLRQRWLEWDGTEKQILEMLVSIYGETTEQTGKRYWVEKTPRNELHLERARQFWADMKAIMIIRDPRSNFASYGEKQERQDDKHLFPETFIVNWHHSLHRWHAFAAAHPASTLTIRYEDLIQQPQDTLTSICTFLGINWDDILLKPTRAGTSWEGNSMYDEKFQSISQHGLNRYKHVPPAVLQILETYLAPLMNRYGYERTQPDISRLAHLLSSRTPLREKLSLYRYLQRTAGM